MAPLFIWAFSLVVLQETRKHIRIYDDPVKEFYGDLFLYDTIPGSSNFKRIPFEIRSKENIDSIMQFLIESQKNTYHKRDNQLCKN